MMREGGREGGRGGGNKYNFSGGFAVEAEWCWLVVNLQVHSQSVSQSVSQYGQQLLYQAIANHHLAGSSMAVPCTGKTDTGLPCHSIYHREGKEKMILFCWSALLCCDRLGWCGGNRLLLS